jgi:hypothetical protein
MRERGDVGDLVVAGLVAYQQAIGAWRGRCFILAVARLAVLLIVLVVAG